MSLKKIIAFLAVAGIVVAGVVVYYVYNKAFLPNTKFQEKEVEVFVPTNATYADVKEILSSYLKNIEDFSFVAEKRKYAQNVRAGKFRIKKGMSNFDIVRAMRSNIPISVAFNNQESINKLVQRLASQIEPDSTALIQAFTNPDFLSENKFTEEDILAMFIPNTYEFYWNTSASKVANKMAKEYTKFWNDERRLKASNLKLTPVEVSILASIVHKETVKVNERPTVAGVYLNRIATGMPLQADPTVIFAMKKNSGDFDQVIKRVYSKDTQGTISPYNTYINLGLPPGPIAMPDISAIDAVLNAEKHDYIYFCANPEKPGYHAFASNYTQHQENARKYSEWVNKLGINR